MSMDRRTFLKVAGGGLAVALTARDREMAAAMAAEGDLRDADLAWSKAPCRYCGTGCGVEVGVHGGKVMAVRGDQASPVNKGLLCVKGYHLPGLLYGKDRLTHPLLRKPGGELQRLSWDEALDLAAEKYTQALADHGP